MQKYTLSETETREWTGHTLRKVIYTQEWKETTGFGDIDGGWIESEKNLSQEGNACVCGNAQVYGNAEIYGNTYIYGDARVCGNARVYSDARVCGNVCISQGVTASMVIRSTTQWHEYQYRKAKLQEKWNNELKKETK